MKKDVDAAYNQREWVREEVVVLVSEYFRTKYMSNKDIKESHELISTVLRNRERCVTGLEDISDTFRNYSGIRMQSGRIRCLDPETEYDGMKGTKLQQEIMNEFLADPERIRNEAAEIIQKYEKRGNNT